MKIPCIIIEDEKISKDISDATKMEKLFNKIDNLKGHTVSEYTKAEFESILRSMLNYVTLIGFEKRMWISDFVSKKYLDAVIYYFDEDVVQILGMKLLMDNMWQRNESFEDLQMELVNYQKSCILNRKCLVFFRRYNDCWERF